MPVLLSCFLPRSSGRRSLIESRFGLRAPKGRGVCGGGAGAERAQPQSGPASLARHSALPHHPDSWLQGNQGEIPLLSPAPLRTHEAHPPFLLAFSAPPLHPSITSEPGVLGEDEINPGRPGQESGDQSSKRVERRDPEQAYRTAPSPALISWLRSGPESGSALRAALHKRLRARGRLRAALSACAVALETGLGVPSCGVSSQDAPFLPCIRPGPHEGGEAWEEA